MTQEITPNTENTNSQIQERREKLNALREQGQAYPNDFHRDAIASDIIKACAHKDNETLEQEEEHLYYCWSYYDPSYHG